jgi:hypothetical protein
MEALLKALAACKLEEDLSRYNTTSIRAALIDMKALEGAFREVLRQRGADGA